MQDNTISRMAAVTVNILLTLRAFNLAVNTGINNVQNYTAPSNCFIYNHRNVHSTDPALSLVNKNERCTVKCPRFRNVTLTYNIHPIYPWGQANYNVLCTGCKPTLAGIKSQIHLEVIYCMGGDIDNRFYEIEVAQEDGRKAYSTVFVEAELKECFTGRLLSASGPGHITFDNIERNEGLSYNNVTGVFTPKRNGYYSFYLTARTRTNRYTKMELRRNGVVVGSITNDVLVEHGWEVEDGATAILLDLKQGDQLTVYANGTLQDGSTMSCFSLRSLMEEPPVVFYATVPEGKVVDADTFEFLEYDNVHIDTAQRFVDNTNYSVPSDGLYVVTLTTSFHEEAIHASYIDFRLKILRYSQLKIPARTSNSFTFILRFNESDIIGNKLYSLYEASLSNETSIAVFKYFKIDETDISAVTVKQSSFQIHCEDFCNPMAYGVVFEDLDSSFDTESGVFTAKRDDTYAISVNLFGTQVDTTFEVVINGVATDVMVSDGPDSDWFVNDSKLVLIKFLSEGDTVELRMKGWTFHYTLLSIWTLTS